ncbi:MAG: hypothetical protein ABGY95_11455 [Rubritalea sp.]|uniref:hypothetical protein n=1 Tax=Rubritalea sp. TaxID=2109375 RepID=UPI003242183C
MSAKLAASAPTNTNMIPPFDEHEQQFAHLILGESNGFTFQADPIVRKAPNLFQPQRIVLSLLLD